MWDCTNLLLPEAGDNEPAQGEIRGRLGAAHSGGCSACIDRIGTLGVLPQSLTPCASRPDPGAGALGGLPGWTGAGGGRRSWSARQ